jgi:DNA-binding transcriptional ArsR family regulator
MAKSTDRLERLLADEIGECCDADLQQRLDELKTLESEAGGDVDRDTSALAALGNDTRYRIVRLLSAAEGDLCVCELDPLLDVSQSAVSHALSDLADAGLVTRRKDGKWRHYATTERADALVSALDDTRRADE